MPNHELRNTNVATIRLFSYIGAAAGAYLPFVYGTWLLLIPSDGTSKFGGLLLVTAGTVATAVMGSFAGTVLGYLCVLLAGRDEKKQRYITLAMASLVAVAVTYTGVSLIARNAIGATTRAFLMTLTSPVNQYRRQNQSLPSSISDLQPGSFTNPFEIDLSAISIQKIPGGYRILHVTSGISVDHSPIETTIAE